MDQEDVTMALRFPDMIHPVYQLIYTLLDTSSLVLINTEYNPYNLETPKTVTLYNR